MVASISRISVIVIPFKKRIIFWFLIRMVKWIESAVFTFIPCVKPGMVSGLLPCAGCVPVHSVNAIFNSLFGFVYYCYDIGHPPLCGVVFPTVGVDWLCRL